MARIKSELRKFISTLTSDNAGALSRSAVIDDRPEQLAAAVTLHPGHIDQRALLIEAVTHDRPTAVFVLDQSGIDAQVKEEALDCFLTEKPGSVLSGALLGGGAQASRHEAVVDTIATSLSQCEVLDGLFCGKAGIKNYLNVPAMPANEKEMRSRPVFRVMSFVGMGKALNNLVEFACLQETHSLFDRTARLANIERYAREPYEQVKELRDIDYSQTGCPAANAFAFHAIENQQLRAAQAKGIGHTAGTLLQLVELAGTVRALSSRRLPQP